MANQDLTPERARLVEDHLGLAKGIAIKHSNWQSPDRPDRDDLIGEAYMGLVEAGRDWDPERGPFVPYAIKRIKWRLQEADMAKTYPVYMPRSGHKIVGMIRSAITRGAESIAEVAEVTGLNPRKVAELWPYRTTGAADLTVAEAVHESEGPTVDEAAFDSVRKQAVAAAIAGLSDDQRAVVLARFGFGGTAPMTTAEISEHLGIPESDVRTLELSARDALLECQTLWDVLDVPDSAI